MERSGGKTVRLYTVQYDAKEKFIFGHAPVKIARGLTSNCRRLLVSLAKEPSTTALSANAFIRREGALSRELKVGIK